MNCKKIMEQNRINSEQEQQFIKKAAKLAINFLTKHNLPLTPRNYDEWFYVACRALDENHILSDKNLEILYKKYIQELNKEMEFEKREMKNLSKGLKEVAQGSKEVLESFDEHLDEHNKILGESAQAIKDQDSQKIDELQLRIKKLENENNKLKKYLAENRKKLKLIEKKFEDTKNEADLDALTNVYNRKKFEKDMKALEEENIPYSVIFLDLDDFKHINDTYGHPVGDRVLQELGEILKYYLRRDTLAYRYGGEEFVILLPNGDIEAAKTIAERLREVIEQRTIPLDDKHVINFTASMGVTQKKEGETVAEVLKRADEALYEAKRNGKNQVVVK